jgi:Sulfotransferase domain
MMEPLADAYTAEEQFRLASVLLVCYPKVGSTWLQTMIAQYLDARYGAKAKSVKQMFLRTMQVKGMEPTLRTHDDNPHAKPVPAFEQDKSHYREKKVILLVRDPRDVVVSYYFWVTHGREVDWPLEPFRGNIDEFVHSPIGGLRTVITFYNIWAHNRHVPREFMLVRYEEVRAHAFAQMCRVLAFLGETKPSVSHLEKVIEFGKFENMRGLEDENAPGLTKPAHIRTGEYEAYKMRRGIVGGYVDYLRPKTIEEMDRIIAAELSEEFSFYYKQENPARAGGLS